MKLVINTLTLMGFILSSCIVYGLYRDISEFDQTKGGYTAPYTNYRGTPVEWQKMDVTPTGLAKRGRVINVLVNATTGMISFQILGLTVGWRKFSERALVVHKPREAFKNRGFNPEF